MLHQTLAGGFTTEFEKILPRERVFADPLRRLAYGTDASFYRLTPQVVVVAEDEAEILAILATCRRLGAPVTFRAAGTSLSGQAVTDSVLVVLGEGFGGFAYDEKAQVTRLGPSIVGGEANRRLAPFGRKIGPDPASIATAKIGGIAANNASGMCCGVGQNSYHTLASLRLALADGVCVDTADSASVAAFRQSHAPLLDGLAALSAEIKARLRHRRPYKGEIPAQEHHRLCDQRFGRFRRSGRNSRASDDRLGRHARLPVACRLPHRAGI